MTGERSATPEHVAGRPPLSGLDARPAGASRHAAERRGGWASSVSCGAVAAVESEHKTARARGPRASARGPRRGRPTSAREKSFDRDYQIRPIGRNGREPGLRPGFHGTMPQDLAVLAEDTPVHAVRMQSNAAIRVVLLGL